MKIDSTLKPTVLGGSTAPARKPFISQATTSSEVHLSEAAARLVASDDNESVDSAKIAEIKQAISEGRFKINTGAIADGLLATARDMIVSRRQA